MTSTRIVTFTFVALLPLCGCKSKTTPPQPGQTTVAPASQPVPSVSDAARKEDERFRREVEAKRRKSHSADIDKTDAYRKYQP